VKGVDVGCIAVNDAFMMTAWANDQNVPRLAADSSFVTPRPSASGFRFKACRLDGILLRRMT
jgi:hypothetical protein